jgi:hypothetical protein
MSCGVRVRTPRIGMELRVTREGLARRFGDCELFVAVAGGRDSEP